MKLTQDNIIRTPVVYWDNTTDLHYVLVTWPNDHPATISTSLTITVQQTGTYTFSDELSLNLDTTPPKIVGGPSIMCPNDTETFTIDAVPGANSYTWNVPTGWRVDGQLGPTVNTTSTSVEIKAGVGSSTLPIRVRTEGQTCGSSTYTTKYIKLDYTPYIVKGPSGNPNVEFDAISDGATSYEWTVPSGWTIVFGRYESTLVARPNGISGYLRVNTETICGGDTYKVIYYNASFFNNSNISDNIIYPNPANNQFRLTGTDNSPLGTVTIVDKNSKVWKVLNTNSNSLDVDISNIPNGIYAIKYKIQGKVEVKKLVVKK